LEPWVQGAKYQLSESGLRYSLRQTLSFVGLSGVIQGDRSLEFYTLDWKSKWAVFSTARGGTAGWVSAQLEDKTGLNAHSESQDASHNLGTLTDPTGLWSGVNGLRVPELAWQQSLREGEIVLVSGVLNQGNYLDQNSYAQSGRSEFNNSALIDNMVLPLTKYNFGLNLQWQPVKTWYTMLGVSAGNNRAGFAPWTHFNLNTWSALGELGYAPSDGLGLGPGIYRIQPFLAQADGPTQGGLGFDLQQQLGRHSPLGWFGRFGFGGEQVARGASAQAGTGLVLHAPLKQLGLVPRLRNDLLGLGFVWSQPSATSKTVYHQNEYVLETFYALQLSPTLRLMPDLQFVWDPAFNSSHDQAAVFQLQLVLGW
ncbi:MAG TPA: carbohydrate porin, partial [Candidatus Sulfotelmatobacter sp.]|nr:carbohydrate porin [Candidatus Sulfotelmatobacter sp.]